MNMKPSMNKVETKSSPPPDVAAMRFQPRDDQLLRAIHELGGVLAKRQIKDMLWPAKSSRAMEKRLAKLYHHGYIRWPEREHWRREPVPESVCWLGWRGIMRLAETLGLGLEHVATANENQLRKLEVSLRRQGLQWMREPRWIQLEHDIAVVDFRLHLNEALRGLQTLTLSEWWPERVFRSDMDVVEFEAEGRDGSTRRAKKGVCPDAYFVLDDERRRLGGEPYRARFLLELDNATHDNPSFGFEKALPGAAYVGSAAYKKRFGHNSGRWLIVTTAGERRMEHLMLQTESRLGPRAGLFYFTTFEQVKSRNLLMTGIWLQGGHREPVALIS